MTSTESPVLAGPPGDCCVRGVKHSGEPVGKTITIAGVQTYISEPPAKAVSSQDKKKVFLYLADVFGPFYINAQLLQDYYASGGSSQTLIRFFSVGVLFSHPFFILGFIVLGIDYFLGDPIQLHNDEPGFDRKAWSAKSKAQANEVFPKWIEEVRKIYGRIDMLDDIKILELTLCYIGTDTKYYAVGEPIFSFFVKSSRFLIAMTQDTVSVVPSHSS